MTQLALFAVNLKSLWEGCLEEDIPECLWGTVDSLTSVRAGHGVHGPVFHPLGQVHSFLLCCINLVPYSYTHFRPVSVQRYSFSRFQKAIWHFILCVASSSLSTFGTNPATQDQLPRELKTWGGFKWTGQRTTDWRPDWRQGGGASDHRPTALLPWRRDRSGTRPRRLKVREVNWGAAVEHEGRTAAWERTSGKLLRLAGRVSAERGTG